jgi:hypothetical protein
MLLALADRRIGVAEKLYWVFPEWWTALESKLLFVKRDLRGSLLRSAASMLGPPRTIRSRGRVHNGVASSLLNRS